MANGREKALRRLTGALGAVATRVGARASVEARRRAIGYVLGTLLPQFYPADRVLHPRNLLEIIVAIYLAIPPEWRFVTHEVIEESIDAWLPDDSKLKPALHDAISATHFATEAFLSRNDLTDEQIRAHLGPTLDARFHHHTNEAPMADHHPPAPAPVADVPSANYFDKRALLATHTQLFFDRLTALGELGGRPGRDDNPQIEGVAAMLRASAVEAVERSEAKSINALLVVFTETEVRNLAAVRTTDQVFLSDTRVLRVVGVLVAEWMRRHPQVSPAIADRLDGFLTGIGVPPKLREPLKRMLSVDSVERMTDRIEDAGYTPALWVLRMWFAAPVAALATVLLTVAVLTVGTQAFVLNEYMIAWDTLSWLELVRRGLGFAMYALYVHLVPLSYLVAAAIVAMPFFGIRRRWRGEWWQLTFGRWAEPARPAWMVERRQGEEAEAFEAREQRARSGIPAEARNREAEEYAAAFEEYEQNEDGYRRAFRRSLTVRAGVALWSMSVIPVVVIVAGIVCQIPTYQHLTLLQYNVIGLIAGHILWLPDDLIAALQRFTQSEEHAEGAASDTHKPRSVTRFHRITGTVMIVILAASLTYAVAIETMGWAWAVGTLLPVYLMLGLAVIIVSRILFGNSEDAPHDVQEDSGKQRRFIHKYISGALGFGGVALLLASIVASVTVNGYGWWQDCKGYEETMECSVFMNGYGRYVDSEARWEALRDREAAELMAKGKPTGDSCAIASKAVAAHNVQYRTSVLSSAKGGPDVEVCSLLAGNGELRGKFPGWSKDCAAKRVACDEEG